MEFQNKHSFYIYPTIAPFATSTSLVGPIHWICVLEFITVFRITGMERTMLVFYNYLLYFS